MTSSKVIILLGPPGVGKGVQAALITKEFSLPHISTGNLFRDNIKAGTLLGNKAKSFIDEGLLVPDELVNEIVLDRLSQEDCESGFLLDGYPRTLDQAKVINNHIRDNANLIVLLLEAEDDVVVERISGRLFCKQCQSTFHKQFNKPSTEGICDHCGGELIQRNDDKESVVRHRLKVYNDQTKPLIDFYQKLGKLKTINAKQTIEKVFKDISDKLRAHEKT